MQTVSHLSLKPEWYVRSREHLWGIFMDENKLQKCSRYVGIRKTHINVSQMKVRRPRDNVHVHTHILWFLDFFHSLRNLRVDRKRNPRMHVISKFLCLDFGEAADLYLYRAELLILSQPYYQSWILNNCCNTSKPCSIATELVGI